MVQFSSVAQSCPTLCNPMDCSTPGFPVHHQLPELAQTHVHWVGDAIQLSHPLSSPSPTFSHSQHQGLFQLVSSSHQVAKVLEFRLQHSPSSDYSGLISFRRYICFHASLSIRRTLSFPSSPCSYVCISITALQINSFISTIFLDSIHIH